MTLVVLLGPTASGKTEAALRLAERFATPVINCDSRQIYRGMEIGTAAPTGEQLARARHYFVGTLDPGQCYSAARYEEDALRLIGRLESAHPVLLLSGGSMMYLDAVCYGIDDMPDADPATRLALRARLAAGGPAPLAEELRRLDPESHARIDLRNGQRLVRALEVCLATGRPYSSFLTGRRKTRHFDIVRVGLRADRDVLSRRIGARVDRMMAAGLVEEARALYPRRGLNALNTVGYKELFRHFDGEWTLDRAVECIKTDTRVYAKKQMTWFARDPSIRWFSPDDTGEIIKYVERRAAL